MENKKEIEILHERINFLVKYFDVQLENQNNKIKTLELLIKYLK